MNVGSGIISAAAVAACVAVAGAATPREQVAAFVDERTAVLVHVDLGRVDLRATGEALGIGALASDIGPWAEALRKAGAADFFIVASLDDLPPGSAGPPPVLVPLGPGADARAIGELLCGGPAKGAPAEWTTCASIRGVVLAGDAAALDRAKARKPVERRDLFEALAAAGDSPVAAVAAYPSALRRVIQELDPPMPAELGGGSLTGLRWASAWVRTEGSPSVRLVVQGAEADAVRPLASLGLRGGAMTGRIDGDRIVFDFGGGVGRAWLASIFGPTLSASGRWACTTNLKQLGLAMHNYHSSKKTFPPAFSVDRSGKPLLSWRVLILPYIDQAGLYGEFRTDEPWDSPHNRTLIERMPKVFACPSGEGGALKPGTTAYVTPRGAASAFPGSTATSLKEITDGASNTIMIVEVPADRAVPWTKPDDWEVPAAPDPAALLSRHGDGAEAAMIDGSVRFLPRTMSGETFGKLLTIAGGEAFPANE